MYQRHMHLGTSNSFQPWWEYKLVNPLLRVKTSYQQTSKFKCIKYLNLKIKVTAILLGFYHTKYFTPMPKVVWKVQNTENCLLTTEKTWKEHKWVGRWLITVILHYDILCKFFKQDRCVYTEKKKSCKSYY